MSTALTISQNRLSTITQEIKERIRRSAVDIYEIGIRLQEVKDGLEHGQYLDWLETNFSMSTSTAENLMRVARKFSPEFLMENPLPSAILYMLASRSTPDNAISAVVDSFQTDIPLTREQTQKIVTAGKYVEARSPEVIKAKVAAGEISLITAEAITRQIEQVPSAVAAAVIRHDVVDPEVIVALTKIYEVALDSFNEIAATGYLQGSGDPIALSKANVRDVQSVLGEIRFEHHLANEAQKSPAFLDANFEVVSVDPDSRLLFMIRVDADSSAIREGLVGRIIMKPLTPRRD